MSSQVISPKDLGLDKEPEFDASVGVATWTRVLLQNWRQGTVGCKGRSDVSASGKKPWKQKGTGRARAGSASSPLWRSGGVIFGPTPRTRTLKFPKNLKGPVLTSVLWDLLKREKLVSLKWEFEGDKPKTSYASKLLKDTGLLGKKVCLILQAGDIIEQASCANIPKLKMVLFDQINVVDLISSDFIVVLDKDFSTLKEVVSRWI
jgi:large subunit ribosomal protein L4